MASALGNATRFTPSFLRPVRVTSATPSNHYTSASLTRPIFAGPWVTSVGGTQGQHPEVATPRSGGGFSYYFECPPYQEIVVPDFFEAADYPYVDDYPDRYKYAPYRDLTFS